MSTARTRTRKAPAERAAEIVAAATDLARDGGLQALTQRAVAERAGVATGLIAHYAGSMDELVARAYSDLVGAELADVRALVAARETAPEKLGAVIATLLDGTREAVTVVWVEGWAASRRNDALAEAVRAQMEAWQQDVAALVRAGIADGVFGADDPDAVAWQLLGMIDGVNAQSLARAADPAVTASHMNRAAEALLRAAPGALSV